MSTKAVPRTSRGKPVGRLNFSGDGQLRRTVRASTRVDEDTYTALSNGLKRDRDELVNMAGVLNYCLKLGIDVYLQGQPDETDPQTSADVRR